MAYVNYEFYTSIYGSALPETDFNRLEYDARRRVDVLTGKKLQFAFPTDEDSIEAVRRCVCNLIHLAGQIEAAEKRVADAQGYEVNQDGSMRGKIVSSVSSGSESVSYTAKTEQKTFIDSVLADKKMQDNLYKDTILSHLALVADSNGVNLLYMGIPYPVRNAPISKPPEYPKEEPTPEPTEPPIEPIAPEPPQTESEGSNGA